MTRKKKLIKLQLAETMREFDIKHKRDTIANFKNLLVKKKDYVDHGIRSLFSYNVLDHPNYIASKKIEKRIVRYYYQKNLRAGSLPMSKPRNYGDLEREGARMGRHNTVKP